jgi:hypothetical protein
MATALINIAFGFGTSLAWFCFFWALNGTLQVRVCERVYADTCSALRGGGANHAPGCGRPELRQRVFRFMQDVGGAWSVG